MSINKENKFTGSLIREFHLWNLPDSAFILLNKEANDEFFKGMYALFGNQLKFAKFLGLSRQGVHKYHKQALKNDGKFYPVYFPLRLLNKCLPLLDKKFMYYLEQNISEIRARVGLSVYNTKLPIIESEEIYRILAHIIADGSASKGKTPYYANICKELREQFKKDLQIFGEMKIYERKPQAVELVFFPKIVTDVLAYLFDIQFTYPNRIPKLLFSAKEEYKKVFLQALFDDEGTISVHLALTIHNTNIMGEIKSLINSLGIETSKVMVQYISYKTNKVHFQIPKKDYVLFQEKIGFVHPEKSEKLELAIRIRNRLQRTRNPNYIEQEILNILEYKPTSTIELANELMFTIHGVMPHLNKLLEEDLIVKRGYKNKSIWDIA